MDVQTIIVIFVYAEKHMKTTEKKKSYEIRI